LYLLDLWFVAGRRVGDQLNIDPLPVSSVNLRVRLAV